MTGMDLVVRGTGEIVNLEDPVQCANALQAIRELEQQLREAKATLTDALRYEFERQGTRTLTFGGVKAELRGGRETAWDVEMLEQLLREGLPPERFEQLVMAEVTFKVNNSIAKQLEAANPRYREIIARARQQRETQPYVFLRETTSHANR